MYTVRIVVSQNDLFCISGGSQFSCPKYASEGGAIYNCGYVFGSNVLFSGNSAGGGGAIYNQSKLELKNSKFSENSSLEGGAAIYNTGFASLDDCTFNRNTNADGGAVQNFRTLEIDGGLFSLNSSETDGGAIWNGKTLSIRNATLEGNTALNGGGIYSWDTTSETTVSNVTFSENQALGNGGAFYNCGTAKLSNVTFSGNQAAGKGGAIYNLGEKANLTLSGNIILSEKTDTVYNAGTLTWNLTNGQTCISDWTLVENKGIICLSVSTTKTSGDYILAGNAASFDDIFTVKGLSTTKTIRLGESFTSNNKVFALSLREISSDMKLVLSVSDAVSPEHLVVESNDVVLTGRENFYKTVSISKNKTLMLAADASVFADIFYVNKGKLNAAENGTFETGELFLEGSLYVSGSGNTVYFDCMSGSDKKDTLYFTDQTSAVFGNENSVMDLGAGNNVVKIQKYTNITVNSAIANITSFSIGKESRVQMKQMNFSGKGTISVDTNSSLSINSIQAETAQRVSITVKASSSLDVSGDILNASSLKLSAGKTQNGKVLYTNVFAEQFTGTGSNDTISTGRYGVIFFTGGIYLKDGKNKISIGQNSLFAAQEIDFGSGTSNSFSVGKGSSVYTAGLSGVQKYTVSSGSFTDFASIVINGDFTGTTANDSLKIGNYAKFNLHGILDLGIGKNTISVGTGATAVLKSKGTDLQNLSVTIGKEATVYMNTELTNLIKKLGKNSTVTDIGELDTAKNFTDLEDELSDNSSKSARLVSNAYDGWLSNLDENATDLTDFLTLDSSIQKLTVTDSNDFRVYANGEQLKFTGTEIDLSGYAGATLEVRLNQDVQKAASYSLLA